MKKSDIRILVVEDDESLGRAIEEGLKRSGFNPKLVASPAAAEQTLRLEECHGMVIDCMLPRKNGVDFATEVRASHPRIEIVLTSGIFRDKSYARDAIIKTKAREFFNKPFELSKLIQTFDDAFAPVLEAEIHPLFQLMQRNQYSAAEKIDAIRLTPTVHGFDLPWIYSLLMDTNISGTLHVAYPDKLEAAVTFSKRRIIDVQYADTESYFGLLLVEMGFSSPEEVDQILSENTGKRIGDRLVDESFVSPHSIGIVRREQMVIRLSKTIQDTPVEIRFKTEICDSDIHIDGLKFTQLLSDWVCSKVTTEWLKTFYRQYLASPLTPGANYSQAGIVIHLPAARVFADFDLTLAWPRTIDDICAGRANRENDLLRAVHFFLVQRILRFEPKAIESEPLGAIRTRLTRIWQDMQDQDHFEILATNKLAKFSDINRNYRELAKILHPDRLPPSAPADLRQLNQEIFARITEAHSTLSDDTRRQMYTKALEHGHAEEILQAETKFEEGMRLLRSSQFHDARKALGKVLKMHGRRSDVGLYYLWALIKEKRHRADRTELSNKVRDVLQTIPHEDRHSAHYFFVKGMYFELIGQIQNSYQSFKRACSIDPEFTDAKKEMTYIKQIYGKKKNKFTDELSIVVTKILGRKTG